MTSDQVRYFEDLCDSNIRRLLSPCIATDPGAGSVLRPRITRLASGHPYPFAKTRVLISTPSEMPFTLLHVRSAWQGLFCSTWQLTTQPRALGKDAQIPSHVIRERITEAGYVGGKTILDDYVRLT